MLSIPSSLRKITAPALPATILHRTALVRRLSDALVGTPPYKLILVHAPAGYGKTTLLAEVALQGSLPCCWYILDHSDSDPLTFLRLLLASLRQRFPSFGEQLVPLLGEDAASSTDNNYPYIVLEALIAAIDRDIPERFAILLCHYQEVSEHPEVTALVECLLNHLPRQGVLVLESREVPALDFASLLAARAMIGFGQDLLHFSSQEIRELAHIQGSHYLSEEEAEQLAAAFDGWITGLLLSTQLSGVGFLQHNFTTSLRHETQGVRIHTQHLFSYVVNEIFKRHQQVYLFLKEIVVLQEMSPILCAALLGIDIAEAREHLQYLERHGLFVSHKGDKAHQIYTFHPVLRDLLYEELRQQNPERFVQLHQRSVEILSANQRYESAIYHALEANMNEVAAQLIIAAAEHLIEQGHLEMLQFWISAFSEEITAHYPRLLLILANIYLKKSELHRVRPLLSQIAGLLNSQPPTFCNPEDLPIMQAELAIAHANVYIQQGKYRQAQECCQQVLERLPADEVTLRVYAHIYQGACAQFLGDFTTKIANYQKALQIRGRHIISYLTADGHNSLADTYRMLGHFTLAKHHSDRAKASWEHLQNISGIINNLIVQAEIRRDQGILSETEALLKQALAFASNPLRLPRLRGYVLVSQGELYLEQGLYDRSLATSEEALAIARQLGDSYLLNYALVMLAQTYLRMGDAATAHLLISEMKFEENSETTSRSIQQLNRNLVMGTILLHEHSHVDAYMILEPTEKTLRAMGLKCEHLKALVYLAACHLEQKQWQEAFQRLEMVEQVLTTFDGYIQRVLTEMRAFPSLQREIQQRPECATLRTLFHWGYAEHEPQKEQQEGIIHKAEMKIAEESISASPDPSLSQSVIVNASPRLEIRAFGEPVVKLDGKPITRWRMAKAMELCFYLLDCKHPIRKERLISAFWEELDERIPQTFYSTIHYLRKALGGESTIRSRAGTYMLDLAAIYGPQGVWYDVATFEELYAQGKQALANKVDEEACMAFESMIELYRGDYVQPFYSDWCGSRRDELQRAYLDAQHQLALLAWHAEKIEKSTAHWQQMLVVDPCLEEAHYGLMRCYIRLGKRGLALRQYQRCTRTLQQELGTLPGPAIQNLYRRLMGLPKAEV